MSELSETLYGKANKSAVDNRGFTIRLTDEIRKTIFEITLQRTATEADFHDAIEKLIRKARHGIDQ